MIKVTLDEYLFFHGKMKPLELSTRSGVNKTTIYALYNNKLKRIDLDVLDRICKTLNCQPGDILRWEPDKEEPEIK